MKSKHSLQCLYFAPQPLFYQVNASFSVVPFNIIFWTSASTYVFQVAPSLTMAKAVSVYQNMKELKKFLKYICTKKSP